MNLTKLKKGSKYIAGLIAAGALLSLAIFPALGMKADAPRFNFLSGDEELFTGARGQDENWSDPISVENGDTFIGRIYYHNGIPETVAENTRVKVTLPDTFHQGDNILNASISADNAETVTDTIIDGAINGKSGLTVNAAENMSVEYVPGSVKWYPDARQTGGAQHDLLFDQTGAELFGSTGLKIGDIQGCWDFAGFVTFVAKVKKIEVPNLAVQKTVRNVSKDTSYLNTVEAEQTDVVNFRIKVTNTGDTDLDPVKVFDQLPAALAAVDGTGRITMNGSSDTFALSDLLSDNGVNLGLLKPTEFAILTFDAVPHQEIIALKTVRNIAIAASGSLQRQDTASVTLLPGNIEIHRAKSAWNLSQNVNAESIPARVGDYIEYTLLTANSGNTSTDFEVRDNLNDILEYADVVQTNGGIINDNGIIIYPHELLAAGGEIIHRFTVMVRGPLPPLVPNGDHFDDLMKNTYGNTVIVPIFREVIVLCPEMVISKSVRNVTSNEQGFAKVNTAYAGDTLEYKIAFKNVGNGPADYLKILDALPANVTLEATSAAILGINGSEYAIAENIQDGFILDTLAPGQEAYIRFKAVIGSGVAPDQTLTNTAYLTSGGETISDIAQTVLRAKVVVVKASPVPNLPRTGSADAILISLLSALGVSGSLALVKSKIAR